MRSSEVFISVCDVRRTVCTSCWKETCRNTLNPLTAKDMKVHEGNLGRFNLRVPSSFLVADASGPITSCRERASPSKSETRAFPYPRAPREGSHPPCAGGIFVQPHVLHPT